MRKALTVLTLLLALSCPTLAGEIPNPPRTPPPPSAPVQPTTQGDMHYPIVQIALTLLGLF